MQANIVNPAAKYQTAEVEALKTNIETKLQEKFGAGILSASIDYDFPVFVVERAIIIDVLAYLYNDSDLQFRFLTTMGGLHFPDQTGQELGMMYQVHNLINNWRIRLKTFMPISDPTVRTATTIFNAANWMERQEFDFFGIRFEGHPNLKRILNMDEMTYHPMRKEYPLEDAHREDKDDSFFGR